jgi:hypothetical protein
VTLCGILPLCKFNPIVEMFTWLANQSKPKLE